MWQIYVVYGIGTLCLLYAGYGALCDSSFAAGFWAIVGIACIWYARKEHKKKKVENESR